MDDAVQIGLIYNILFHTDQNSKLDVANGAGFLSGEYIFKFF